MELCIDTSTRYASVGISQEGRILVELAWRSERNHSVELVPALRRVMEHAVVSVEDLTAVFAALGPGGFSALRVGLSVAKSLAMARGIPLVGVNTLDIEAAPFLGLAGPLSAVIGAGRSKVYLGRYVSPSSQEPDYRVVERERLEETLDDGTILCGEEAGAVRDLISARVSVIETPPPTRTASALAKLAYDRLRVGSTDDPDMLQPIYMHSAQFEKAKQARERRKK
jgi:tRNA threonylcarbamoyladenosine biosynthesis protein TsaB